MIYDKIPGGVELLAWFGVTPTFRDAEIISLSLNRSGISELKIHTWIMTDKVDPNGYYVLDKHAIVTFTLEGLMDLQLEGFSHQNVIGRLNLGFAKERVRANNYSRSQEPSDIDLELEPCYGLEGFIRARKVEISFTPGKPDKVS